MNTIFLLILYAAFPLNGSFVSSEEATFIAIVTRYGYLVPIAGIDSSGTFYKPWPEPGQQDTSKPNLSLPHRWFFHPYDTTEVSIDTIASTSLNFTDVYCQFNWVYHTSLSKENIPKKSPYVLGLAFSLYPKVLSREQLKQWTPQIDKFREENHLRSNNKSGESFRRVVEYGWYKHRSSLFGVYVIIGYESYHYVIVEIRDNSIDVRLRVSGGDC